LFFKALFLPIGDNKAYFLPAPNLVETTIRPEFRTKKDENWIAFLFILT